VSVLYWKVKNICMLQTKVESIKQITWNFLTRPGLNPIFFIELPFNLDPPIDYSKNILYLFASQLGETVIYNCGNPESDIIEKFIKH
jgi:hypothetical protein